MTGGGGVGNFRPDKRALNQRTRWTGVFFLVYQESATSPVISAGLLAPKSCEYGRCAQFHSRNELIVYCLISGGSYKCNVEC